MSVMNVKRGTTSFSKAEQSAAPSSAPRPDSVNTTSASAMKAAFGDQNVGDILNQISDPNWVDPSKKVRTTGDPSLGKDAFMKLMLTQMKYQDPTNPMQSHEMAAQLAQFSSLEQLSNIHGTLESMKTQSSPSLNYQALALIGKKVAGDSSKLVRGPGDKVHGIGFELVGDAAKVTVNVKDSTGAVVRKMNFAAMKKGQNSIDWNGLKEDGAAARAGEYKITVEAVNSAGKKVFAKTSFDGKITGLNFTPEGPVLLVGNKTVKLADVKKIEDAKDLESKPGSGEKLPAGGGAIPLNAGDSAKASDPAAKKALADQLAAKMMKIPSSSSSVIPSSSQPSVSPETLAQPATVVKPEMSNLSQGTAKQQSTHEAKDLRVANEPATEEELPAAEEGPETGNINSVPMSRELLAQLEKQI